MTALQINDPAYFERLADVESRHWWSLGMWRLASCWLDSALAGRSGLRGLDVGCGTGLTAARLAARPEIVEVVGLDPSPDALRLAATRHGGRLVQGSALDLPFQSNSFALATCFDVFQHLPPAGDRRAADELRRVLCPGGIAVVRSNGRGWSSDGSAYRLATLVGLLNDSGFQVLRATYANLLPSLAQETRGRFSRWTRPLHGRVGPPSHPSGGGLRIQVPCPTVNLLMSGVSGIETWLSGRLGLPLPFGHSTLILAERLS